MTDDDLFLAQATRWARVISFLLKYLNWIAASAIAVVLCCCLGVVLNLVFSPGWSFLISAGLSVLVSGGAAFLFLKTPVHDA